MSGWTAENHYLNDNCMMKAIISHKINQIINTVKHKRREGNQLDSAECFIVLIICSTCFRHLYAHHQELKTILVLLPHMVCNALVAGGRQSGAVQQAMRLG